MSRCPYDPEARWPLNVGEARRGDDRWNWPWRSWQRWWWYPPLHPGGVPYELQALRPDMSPHFLLRLSTRQLPVSAHQRNIALSQLYVGMNTATLFTHVPRPVAYDYEFPNFIVYPMRSHPTVDTEMPNVIVYQSAVSVVYTPSPNMVSVIIEGVGGGGGGGNAIGAIDRALGGGGGGSGAGFKAFLTKDQVGASQVITVGAGGLAEAQGGATSFGSLAIAGGGAPGSRNIASPSQNGQPGNGGVASLASSITGLAVPGNVGLWGQNFGAPLPNAEIFAGAGGSLYGGASGIAIQGGTGIAPGPNGAVGAGGGGAVSFGNAGMAVGGRGGDGWLSITEFIAAPPPAAGTTVCAVTAP